MDEQDDLGQLADDGCPHADSQPREVRVCSFCGGRGWVAVELWRPGQIVRAECQECRGAGR